MHRRRFLGVFGAGVLMAGCLGSRVNGEVTSNETPLVFSHEYVTQGTPSGTRILVEVTAENDGDDPITPDSRVPNIACRFFDDAGEVLHETGKQLVQPVGVGESVTLEFPLTIDTDDVKRYEIRSEWVET